MISVNVAELRTHLGEYLGEVERGNDLEICKRNRAVARIVKIPSSAGENRTSLGSLKGSIRIIGDIVEPAFLEDDWEMHD